MDFCFQAIPGRALWLAARIPACAFGERLKAAESPAGLAGFRTDVALILNVFAHAIRAPLGKMPAHRRQ